MKKATLSLGVFVAMFWALQAYAGGPFKQGTTEWAFSTGYGRSFHLKGQFNNVDEDIKFVPFLVSWNKVFKEFSDDASLAYAVEAIASYAKQEGDDAYLAGVTPLVVYNFKTCKKLTPYVDAGVGFVVTDLDPEGFGGDWGFTPQIGVGFRYAVKDSQFIRFSYRYHHISNGGLKVPNKSIDSNFFFIGYSFVR